MKDTTIDTDHLKTDDNVILLIYFQQPLMKELTIYGNEIRLVTNPKRKERNAIRNIIIRELGAKLTFYIFPLFCGNKFQHHILPCFPMLFSYNRKMYSTSSQSSILGLRYSHC